MAEIKENLKVTKPVAVAADRRGYTLAGLHKLACKELKEDNPYVTFTKISRGEMRNDKFEGWFERNGFKTALRKAQREYRKAQREKAKKNGSGK